MRMMMVRRRRRRRRSRWRRRKNATSTRADDLNRSENDVALRRVLRALGMEQHHDYLFDIMELELSFEPAMSGLCDPDIKQYLSPLPERHRLRLLYLRQLLLADIGDDSD